MLIIRRTGFIVNINGTICFDISPCIDIGTVGGTAKVGLARLCAITGTGLGFSDRAVCQRDIGKLRTDHGHVLGVDGKTIVRGQIRGIQKGCCLPTVTIR